MERAGLKVNTNIRNWQVYVKNHRKEVFLPGARTPIPEKERRIHSL